MLCECTAYVSEYGFVSFMSSFICHFQLFPRVLWSHSRSHQSQDALWSPDQRPESRLNPALSLFLSAACYSSCCCSSGSSRCVYLLCPPPPPSCSLITAVRQLCLGVSHSIVLAPPSPKGALVGVGAALPVPAHETGLVPNLCDTWHLGALSALCLRLFCLPFLPGQSLLHSAADRRHLVSACAGGLPASAALKPNCRTQLQAFASVSLLPLLFCCMPILPFHSFITTLPSYWMHFYRCTEADTPETFRCALYLNDCHRAEAAGTLITMSQHIYTY